MSNDINPRITYVRDPDLVPVPTPVFMATGSVSINLYPGDIEIGAVELKDKDSDTRAKIIPANAGNSPTDNVLLVQSVDPNGEVILRDDIQNIDAGMDVLIAGHAQSHTTLTAVLNGQGTLSKTVDVQATTAAIQEQTNFLQAGSVAPHIFTLFNNQVGSGTSPNADVSGFFYHSIQHTISGSLTVDTRTSLDGINWSVDGVTQQSIFYTFEGKAKYFSCRAKIGDGTVTSVIMSG